MLTLFKLSLGVTFDNVLNLVLDFRFPIIKVTPETHTKLVDKINNTNTFSPRQKQILIDTLPNATPQDILRAAGKLYDFGSEHSQNSPERLRYYDNIAALYKRSATHPDATPEVILFAGRSLRDLGVPYYDRAAVYNLCAVHKNATPLHIRRAALGFYTLGTPYHGRTAELYELSANHPNATPEIILSIANGLRVLDDPHNERADALLKKHGLAE